MATEKKTVNLTSDDVSPSTDSTKVPKTEKRDLIDPYEIENDVFKPSKKYQATKKKAKANLDITQQAKKRNIKHMDDSGNVHISELMSKYRLMKYQVDDTEAAEIRKKVQRLLSDQQKARKKLTDSLFTNCSEILTQFEADYNTMKTNELKLDQLTATFMQTIHQTTSAFKENAKTFSKIHSLKKQFDEMESRQIGDQDELMCELDNDIKKLQEKLEKETKKQAWEQMCQRISHAIQD